ncbi:hypothetical protein P4637_17280 [Halalkalibacterium halodurans]|uniref:hypothetical protein n=1 Tax=Halalkalibacterium halodurans TaxID=86665 RepID=UPI002E1ACDFC|nr:hypothetical protein [Halalkalibacterium halodurans]MED4086568.1 hypothetical protein [Halalkalibacterium halodurans]MED4103434.1 hypothetical protein [Halalkalibacterium halodurans]MED4111143.1 hypothetical protein [Halalkalibacterium halodurans]MED4126391.1 hypothetical protein [Halalkalibacterium halodurans]
MVKQRPFMDELKSDAFRIHMELKDKLKVVDSETGAVLDYYRPEPVMSEEKKRLFKFMTKLDYHADKYGGFIIAFFEGSRRMTDIFPDLTQADYARLLYVSTYTAYSERDDLHCYLKHDNGHFINRSSLYKLLGVSRNTFSVFYRKLIDNNIIQELDGKLAINPAFFFRGEIKKAVHFHSVGTKHTRVFRRTVRELYKEYGQRKTKQLGILYAILPYVNFRYNILCHNPAESNCDLVQPIKLGELAGKLGYRNASKLKTAMRGIRFEDMPVFQFVEDAHDNRQRKVIVNPALFYASGGETLEAAKALFKNS